jgi:hypothetical protein
MDILNYISWIAGKKRVVTSVPDDALLPVGIRTESRDDKYTTVAIKKSDLAAQLGGDRLIAGNREVVLGIDDDNNDTTLTFSPGDVIIQTTGAGADLYIRSLGGDDIFIESGDDITLRGDQGTYDAENEGGDINIYAGDGSDGDTNDAGSGGDVRIEAGDAGNSISGNQGEGGFVTIQAGYTTASGLSGGDISLRAGNSVSGIYGDVTIQGNFTWTFYTRNGTILFPAVTLATLPNPAGVPGARAVIADSTAFASGNFGVQAVGGGANIVPVFSDGVNWLIG